MAKTSKKNRSVLFKILFIFFLIFFLVSAGMVIKNHREAQQSALQFHKLAELPAVAPPEVTLTAAQRYAPLKELNSDFFGWLKIEGTNVDYPVCCSPEDPEFYLRRGFDKKYSYYGVPFTEEDAFSPENEKMLIENMRSSEATDLLDDLKEELGVTYNNTVLEELSVVNLPKVNEPKDPTEGLKDQLTDVADQMKEE